MLDYFEGRESHEEEVLYMGICGKREEVPEQMGSDIRLMGTSEEREAGGRGMSP